MEKNIIRLALVMALFAFMAPRAALAQNSTTIDAVAIFTDGVLVGNEADIDFSNIEFSVAPGAGDTVSIGTNGNIVYAGNFGGLGTGTAGNVDVTFGTNGLTVEVFCDTTATLTNGAGASIDLVGIETAAENATGGPGAGNPCNGVAGAAAASLVLNTGVLDSFKFGGQLDGATAAGFVSGNYSTGMAGGDDIQIDVFYQ